MEHHLIQTLQELLPNGFDCLGDDAYTDHQTQTVLSTDMMVENQHFRWRYFSPYQLGWKLAAVNLSDLAAMGASPHLALVSLAIPVLETQDTAQTKIKAMYNGMLACAKAHGPLSIVGGDTVGNPAGQWILNMTIMGLSSSTQAWGMRHHAQPGDVILLGKPFEHWGPGLAGAGLLALENHRALETPQGAQHLRQPIPMVQAGLWLKSMAHRAAIMDTSDGLADALLQIAEKSGVTLHIKSQALPLHNEVAHWAQHTQTPLWHAQCYGAEDYGLLACVSTKTWQDMQETNPCFVAIGNVHQATDNKPQALVSVQNSTIELSAKNRYQQF